MKLEQSFSVQAPLGEVWSALIDVERVAPCLPGAEITERGEDGEYHGTFSVRLGPTSAAYRGTLRLDSVDEAAREATMSAKGTDKRGQGGASATIVNRLREEDGGTRVEVSADFTITGRLASFGRSGMIEDISKRLLRDFADCLQATLAAPSAEAAEPQPASLAPSDEEAASAAVASAGAAVSEAAAAAAPPPHAAPVGEEPVAPAEPATPRTGSVAPPSSQRVEAAMPAKPAVQAKPIKGISLFFSVLWERIRGLFSRKK
jgi:carbon monoxide dehydrogenase subunit G